MAHSFYDLPQSLKKNESDIIKYDCAIKKNECDVLHTGTVMKKLCTVIKKTGTVIKNRTKNDCGGIIHV